MSRKTKTKETKSATVDPEWNDELAKTCPKKYPWACSWCKRPRDGSCSGREG
jgi:hypothetical protein